MPLALQRCSSFRTLHRSLNTIAPRAQLLRECKAENLQALAAYPIFNLNDESGRQLGPRHGDEAVLTLSGGVDSSVASYLAISKGGLLPIKTVFMRNWNSLEENASFKPGSGGSQGCQWQQDWEKVVAMAKWLGVEAELVSAADDYIKRC
jgi:asparagine synthetase B (glutamine-hydrolysing)